MFGVSMALECVSHLAASETTIYATFYFLVLKVQLSPLEHIHPCLSFIGKGVRICGSLSCQQGKGLDSYETNFIYKESGIVKQALVKIRLCPKCSDKLSYKKVGLIKKL